MKRAGYLNVARINFEGSYALGPGRRFVIWLQGCPFNCVNCTTPEYIPWVDANWVNTLELAAIIAGLEKFDGLTISGGEPMAQAPELAVLLEYIRQSRPDLTVILFTGYRLEALKTPFQQRVVASTDVVIDGLYIDELNDSQGLRGSSNQKVHLITRALEAHAAEFESGERRLEFVLDGVNVHLTGIKPKDFFPIF